MKINIGVVTYAYPIAPLLQSIGETTHDLRWIFHHHGHRRSAVADHLRELQTREDTTVHWHCSNRGLARSWNEIINASLDDETDVIMLINDDVTFLDGTFDKFIDFARDRNLEDLCFASGFEKNNNVFRTQGFACCTIGRNVIETIGYFDENFCPAYYEDVDFMMRVQLANVRFHMDERWIVNHDRGSTLRNDWFLELKMKFQRRRIQRYFDCKWGMENGLRTHATPFGRPEFDLTISWDRRAAPYGTFRLRNRAR